MPQAGTAWLSLNASVQAFLNNLDSPSRKRSYFGSDLKNSWHIFGRRSELSEIADIAVISKERVHHSVKN